MSWTCECASTQPDDAKFCHRCGRQNQPTQVPTAIPAAGNAWKFGAIAGVLIVGVVFGTLVAVMVFGGGTTHATAPQAGSDAQPGSAFKQAFEDGFKKSCRQAAMRSGRVSQASADNYCSCALPVFTQTHSMSQAVDSCKQYIFAR